MVIRNLTSVVSATSVTARATTLWVAKRLAISASVVVVSGADARLVGSGSEAGTAPRRLRASAAREVTVVNLINCDN